MVQSLEATTVTRYRVELVSPQTLPNGARPSAELDLLHLSLSLVWRGISTAKLELSVKDPGYDLCVLGNYLVVTDTLPGSTFAWVGRIENIVRSQSSTKDEQKTATASDLRSLIYTRVVTQSPVYRKGIFQSTVPSIAITGATESIAKALVRQECVGVQSALVSPRKIPGFAVARDQSRGQQQIVQVTGEPLSQLITQVLAVDDMGDGVSLEPDFSLTYEVFLGEDLTSTPAGNIRQEIFTADSDNVSEISYEQGVSGMINAVLVLGKQDTTTTPPATARPQMWVEDEASIAKYGRYEQTVDASDASTAPQLESAGLQLMAQHLPVNRIGFTARETQVDRFGVNWNVGDLVTVELPDWGIEQDLRIQQVDLTFGNPDLRTDALPMTFDETGVVFGNSSVTGLVPVPVPPTGSSPAGVPATIPTNLIPPAPGQDVIVGGGSFAGGGVGSGLGGSVGGVQPPALDVIVGTGDVVASPRSLPTSALR